jgi:hypothetical protein
LHADAVEADLSRYHQIDVRDRWRLLPDGSRALTLRMISVRVKYLPPESAVASIIRDGPHWSLGDVLLAHVWQAAAHSKKPHPMLAKAGKQARRAPMTPEKQRRLTAAKARARDRKRRLAKEG